MKVIPQLEFYALLPRRESKGLRSSDVRVGPDSQAFVQDYGADLGCHLPSFQHRRCPGQCRTILRNGSGGSIRAALGCTPVLLIG